MAKDDYFVIVFRILKHLYKQLKAGLPPEPEMLRHDSKTCNVNEAYWRYIVLSMQEEGLIRGLKTGESQMEENPLEDQLANIQITPKGIELLSDNRMSERVDGLIKGALGVG